MAERFKLLPFYLFFYFIISVKVYAKKQEIQDSIANGSTPITKTQTDIYSLIYNLQTLYIPYTDSL